jgi:hypothetical protein
LPTVTSALEVEVAQAEPDKPAAEPDKPVVALDKQEVGELVPDKPAVEARLVTDQAFALPIGDNSGNRCTPGELLSRILGKST